MSNGIYEAMVGIMTDIGAIGKDQKNAQQGFMFRGIDTVYNELHDIMAKHKVFTLPEVLEDKSEERQTRSGANLIYRILKIKYRFTHADGSSIDAVVIGEGMDSGDKASNKAMSVAHKYCLLQAFCIPTEEIKDPDAESHEVAQIPAKPPETARKSAETPKAVQVPSGPTKTSSEPIKPIKLANGPVEVDDAAQIKAGLVNSAQIAELRAAVKESGIGKYFMGWFHAYTKALAESGAIPGNAVGIDKVEQLPSHMYAEILQIVKTDPDAVKRACK